MKFERRDFLKVAGGAGISTCLPFTPSANKIQPKQSEHENVLGPMKGYTPMVGTLASTMIWMRDLVLSTVRDLSIKDLDYVHDEDSNSIGAMLLHLAAVDRYYQTNTFGSENACSPKEMKLDWSIPMNLGQRGRNLIKNNPLSFYEDIIAEMREHTFAEFAQRDDQWLLSIDESFSWGPTNNLCKWFHVCEHESNHNGQIKYIKKRLHRNG